MKRRHGFSLTELSVTMMAGSTLMLLAVSMVHEAFQWTHASKDRVQANQSFDNLQRQLRRDVHLADNAVVEDNTLRLSVPGEEEIAYTIDSRHVKRTQMPDRREAYYVGESIQLSLSQRSDPQRVVLSGHRKTPLKNIDPPAWRHIEAVVGYLDIQTKETP